jgi:uncharacterized protein YqeY
MNLEERLVEEMKQAMKSNDKLRLSTIRMIRSGSKNKEIELRKKLEDEDIVKVIQVMVRKGEEAVEQFQSGGRMDLVEKEKREIEILKSFLPQPLDQEEILKMKSVIPKIGGKADGKLINQLVKERLSP